MRSARPSRSAAAIADVEEPGRRRRAERAGEQDRAVGRAAQQRRDDLQRGLVGPVQVVEREQQRPADREPVEQLLAPPGARGSARPGARRPAPRGRRATGRSPPARPAARRRRARACDGRARRGSRRARRRARRTAARARTPPRVRRARASRAPDASSESRSIRLVLPIPGSPTTARNPGPPAATHVEHAIEHCELAAAADEVVGGRAHPSSSWTGSAGGGTVSSSAPSTPALFTAGLAGAAAVRAPRAAQQLERRLRVDVGREPRRLRLGRVEHAGHAVVDGRADRVGGGGEDGHRREPLAVDAALVPEAGEGEQRTAVDRVAERHALAARALGPQPLVPAVGDHQAAAVGARDAAARTGAWRAASRRAR